MRIIDTFMLRDELDMLEGRLAELDGLVASHVLVESPVDHRGNPKPLWFMENRERFAPWKDRIIHVVAEPPAGTDPWVREHAQRTAIWPALDEAGDDDVILLCDVDEFPPPEAFTRLPEPAFAHEQRLNMYAVDWEYPDTQLCSVSVRAGWARRVRGCPRGCGVAACATAIRDYRDSYPRLQGGRHIKFKLSPTRSNRPASFSGSTACWIRRTTPTQSPA